MTSYKAYKKNELYYIFAYVGAMAVAAVVTGKPVTALMACGIFIPLFAGYNLLVSKLTEIRVDKKKAKLTLIYGNYINKKKELVFELANTEFTYKQCSTFRADKKNICTLYNEGKEIVKMRHGNDGWTSDQIFDLVHELKGLGVKRKFTGYMMKDAEV